MVGLPWMVSTVLSLAGPLGASSNWLVSGSGSFDQLGGWGASANLTLPVHPARQLGLTFEPHYRFLVNRLSFVAAIDTGGPTATYGRRYALATSAIGTLDAQVTASWSPTPDLTVEGFAQLYVSHATFSDYGELTAPRSLELSPYVLVTGPAADSALAEDTVLVRSGAALLRLPAPSFGVTSLRVTVVLRWEFLPGSTIFLAWQHHSEPGAPTGALASAGGLRGALASAGDNYLALKVSYWCGRF